MLNFTGTLGYVILIGSMVGILSGCGSGASPVEEGKTATAVIAEIQNVPEATATAEATPAPDSSATDLPTEIGEPVSPISPVAPEEKPAMSRAQNLAADTAPGSEEPLAAAIADLAEQTGMPVEEIELVSIESMEWNDASLGCPQEGYMYAQVITPGYKIVLAAQGQQYEYHTDEATSVVLCNQ